jgi:hypothetical protein
MPTLKKKTKSYKNEDDDKKFEEEQKALLEAHLAVRKLLRKHGAMPFHLVKISENDDASMKEQQTRMNKKNQGLGLNWVYTAFTKDEIKKKVKAPTKSKYAEKKKK